MEKRLRFRYRFCSILIIFAVIAGVAGFSGCREETDGSDHIFIYDLPVNPRTLDPQTAVDRHARLVIANIFDGLLRMDSEGNVIPGVAKEYTLSDDLKTYTFHLREDVFWTDADGFYAQCTAHDFVFGFRRLFNPETRSPHADNYFSILNARQVNEGEMPVESVGVSAENDFTLVIQLEYPDSNLPILLTAPPAFPCNEEFFIQAAGRYGLITAESPVPSNGGFYIREWVYDPWWTYENRIILRRNEKNSVSERVYPREVNFLMSRGGHLANFTGGESDCIIISGDGVDSLIDRGYSYTGIENSVWGITFNMSGVSGTGVFEDENLRLALALSTDVDDIGIDLTGYRGASSLIPGGINIEAEPVPLSVDPAVKAKHFSEASRLIDSMTEHPVLIVPVVSEQDAVLAFVRAIAQQWQEKLSFFCRIEALPPYEHARRLADGDYDIAAVNITASYNSPSAILDALLSKGSNNENAVEFLRLARQAQHPEEISKYFRLAENAVLRSAEFIPFSFMTEYFFKGSRNRRVEDLVYNPFTGAIVFRNAKMF